MTSNRHQIQFFASLTVTISDIHKIQAHLAFAHTPHTPLQNILTTPLFVGSKSLDEIRTRGEAGACVMFDSGGYYVQTGRISYDALYAELLKSYKQHKWANIYVLPDNVPRSQDTPDVVEHKVQNTIEQSINFFRSMPDELKPRAMPVVHGHTYQQIDDCLNAYINLGVKQIGFGSFGTMGKNSQVNVATQSALEYARYTVQIAHQHGIRVHTFGMGVPVVVLMLYGIRADTFDSSSWLKAAGFGQIFLPLTRAYNITHRNSVSELQRGIKWEDFCHLREVTGHQCELCSCRGKLQEHKMYRAAHNLIVLSETVQMLNSGSLERTKDIYQHSSERYQKEFNKWLPLS
jgi:queuine/archaeosine tRNA-ribosyltransferase